MDRAAPAVAAPVDRVAPVAPVGRAVDREGHHPRSRRRRSLPRFAAASGTPGSGRFRWRTSWCSKSAWRSG
ncbi:hypothetical protein FHX46_005185 [Amycolatopsis viridis]|uniref:Uncharacterized protein n=1 Tax=Amycolatopsis viridis TaxID=185678 RepID=A0ABX0T4Z5_9PSEU|nr:hypothetical protein [Amycolatopsis viridis]